MLLPVETHSLSAACRTEAVWAPLRVAEQGFKETPPPCVTQTGGDDQGTEISHQPAAPSGKVLWGFPASGCFQTSSDLFWSVRLSSPLQMLRVEAPRLTLTTPSLPPQLPYQFDVLQSSHELLQHFKLFCDWAYRAFLSLKPKVSAVQW